MAHTHALFSVCLPECVQRLLVEALHPLLTPTPTPTASSDAHEAASPWATEEKASERAVVPSHCLPSKSRLSVGSCDQPSALPAR